MPDQYSPDDIEGLENNVMRRAEEDGVNPALYAHQYGLPINTPRWWWAPKAEDDPGDVYVEGVDLIAGSADVLSAFVKSLAASIQFPESTAYLHGLGVVSAAMVERFFYRFNGAQENTVALYTVGAQPPSTGKSGIDGYLCEPAHKAYTEKRKQGELRRKALKRKIAKLTAELKKAKSDTAAEVMEKEMLDLEEELAECPDYVWAVNDPTPEGCEKVLGQQNGWFNVVSDESSAVKVVLGMVYGDRAANNGVFLKAWDNGYLSVARSGRDGYIGKIRGSMAILAQDESVSTILRAGQSGEGISERFLIIREKNLLGTRDHLNYTPVDRDARDAYGRMIENIINEPGPVYLYLSPEAERLVREIKQEQEPLMMDGGKFSTPMLRGVVGKNEKQIIKIACVLHCVEQWAPGGRKGCEIQVTTIVRAAYIFNQLLQTYVAAADSKGFTGARTELEKLVDVLTKCLDKGKPSIEVRKLRDRIKNSRPFDTIPELTKKLKEDYLPELEANSYVVFDSVAQVVHINPRLK